MINQQTLAHLDKPEPNEETRLIVCTTRYQIRPCPPYHSNFQLFIKLHWRPRLPRPEEIARRPKCVDQGTDPQHICTQSSLMDIENSHRLFLPPRQLCLGKPLL
jgi:hypothetical protein